MRYALVVLLVLSLARPVAANPPAEAPRCGPNWVAILGLSFGLVSAAGIAFRVIKRDPTGLLSDGTVAHEPEFGEEDGLCCVCRYMAIDECAKLSEKKCGETKIAPRYKFDCRWHDGRCQSRFATYCEQWRDAPQQKGCLTRLIQAEGSPYGLKEAFAGKSCRKVRYRYSGHGRSGLTLRTTVKEVLTETPAEITSFQFDDDGCSTFSNVGKSTTRMREFIDEEKDLLKGKSVLISANQCNANIEHETQARYLFEIDGNRAPAGMTGRAKPCGTDCRKFQSGQTVSCLDGNKLVKRTCRCQQRSFGGERCQWEK